MTSSGTPRTALVFAAFLVAVLGLALVFAPRLIDLRSLTPTIAAELSRALGQDVNVRGDVFLSLIPGPQLIIRDVATNAYDGSRIALSAGEVRADLSWRDLALGRYSIETLTLRRPEIDLPVFIAPNGTLPPLRLDHARLRLHRTPSPLLVEGLDASLTPSASGALVWTTSGVVNGIPITFDGKLGVPTKSNSRNCQLTLKLPEADVAIDLSGAVSLVDGRSPSFKGRASLSALRVADAVSLTAFANDDLSRWTWSTQPLSVSSDIEVDEQRLTLANGDVTFGDQTARLFGSFDFATQPKLNLDLELTNIDAAQWLPIAPPSNSKVQATTGAGFWPQTNWTAGIKINGTVIKSGNQALRDFSVDLSHSNSEWAIRNAAITLPGQARITLAGLWTAASEDAGFTGSWRGDIQDVRSFLNWLGIDSAAIPADRLSSFSASGLIQNNEKLTVLSDLLVAFDATQATGRISFSRDKAAPFAIDLDVDRLALDAYAPLVKQGINAIIGLSPTSNAQNSGYGINPLVPWLGNLTSQRGLVRVAVPSLTWRDVLAGPLGVDVAFGDGVIDIRSIAFTDASGAAAFLGGKIKNLDGVPTAERLQFDVKIGDVARFARATRSELSAPLRALAPWSVAGAINGSLLDATVSVDGKLGSVTGSLRGRASFTERDAKLNATLDVSHPNASQLRSAAWPGVKFTSALDGPMAISAKIKLDGKKVEVADIAASIGRNHLSGKVEVDRAAQPKLVNVNIADIDIDFTALTPLPVMPIPPPGAWQGEITYAGTRLKTSLLDASAFSARFVAALDSIELAEWQGKLFGGPAQAGLKWSKSPNGVNNTSLHQLQGQIVLGGADPLRVFGVQAAPSKAQADLTISFSAAAPTPLGWLAALSGAGTFKMAVPANAALKFAGVFAPIAAAAHAESPTGSIVARQEASASFSISNGVATTQDLKVQSNAYGGTFMGAVNMREQTFDLMGTLRLRDRGLIAGPSAQLVLPPSVPMTITGPMATPTIKLDLDQR